MGIKKDPKMKVPTIYKAYFSGLCKGISLQNKAKNMVQVQYLHFRILKFPLIINCLVVEPYPSEKYDFVSWDDFPFPTVSGKSFKIPWFQTTNQISSYWYKWYFEL